MATKKPKTVKIQVPVEPIPEPTLTIAPSIDLSQEIAELETELSRNGIAGLEGYEDLIREYLPEARSNNNVKYPLIENGVELNFRTIVERIEAKDEIASEVLYKIVKRHERKAGATIYLRMRILELEDLQDGKVK